LSAGNSGIRPWHYIGAPSDADSALSIGAVDSAGSHIFFSSFGPSSDGDVKPNVCAQGYECRLSDDIGAISQGSGTSFSCPILAGAAACLWQAFPSYSAMDIKKAIEKSSSLFFTPNDSMGFGIPDFSIASFLLSTGNAPLTSKDNLLGVYPNPFSENFNVRFYSKKSQGIEIEIIDAIGRVISTNIEEATGGLINTFLINGNKIYRSGIYIVRVSTHNESFINRVIKY
jgi:serine protease AprX